MTRRALGIALFAALLFQAGSATAKSWVIDYDHSHLGFTGMQNAATFDGTFKKFTATIDFDPDHPESGKIAATIDMASAATGNATRDGALPGADWFDTKKFPQAQFVSTHIDRTGASSYEAQGTLTIKGIAKTVVLPFTLRPEGDHWRAQGKVSLIRNEFGVGQGDWASEDTVAWAVDVTLDLAAKPAP
jgi:polyisoprenoid-binding protein YceI